MARGRTSKSAATCIPAPSFFTRPPSKWILQQFVQERYPKFKQYRDAKRRILGAWTGTLKKIEKCGKSSRSTCAGANQHQKATKLLGQYKTAGSRNHREVGSNEIQRLINDDNGTVTVQKMVVHHGNGNGNVVYADGDSSVAIGCMNSSGEGRQSAHSDEAVDSGESMDEASSSSSVESEAFELEEADKAFETAYRSFQSDQKWVLPSGATVEDVLHGASPELFNPLNHATKIH